MLDGELLWLGRTLAFLDYGYWPKTEGAVSWVGGKQGATLLLFLDPPRDTDSPKGRIQRNMYKDWLPATVALRDTGIALALKSKELLYDPVSGGSAFGYCVWILIFRFPGKCIPVRRRVF